ncbi:hypothetical protein GW915_04960 [bacterium]|nr:hypothetical protein [bacterium]
MGSNQKSMFLAALLLFTFYSQAAEVMKIREGVLLKDSPSEDSGSTFFARPGHLLLAVSAKADWYLVSDGLHTGWVPTKFVESTTSNKVMPLYLVSDLKQGKIQFKPEDASLSQANRSLTEAEQESLVKKAQQLEKKLGNGPSKLYRSDQLKKKK